MPARTSEPTSREAAISVSEMARRVTLSRARFYELIEEGVFPMPVYCIWTRRALYTAEAQRQCLEVRATNMGLNGRYVLFYSPRGAASAAAPRRGRPAAPSNNPLLSDLREGLTALGMASVSDDQLRAALEAAFPSGTAGIDSGAVLASIFRQLRRPTGARSPNAS
jgi:hypothetical protein